jgi:hypothetical protein
MKNLRLIELILISLAFMLSGCVSDESVLMRKRAEVETLQAVEVDYANATEIAIQAKRIEQARATLEALAAQATSSETVLEDKATSTLETVLTTVEATAVESRPTIVPTSLPALPTESPPSADCYKAGFIADVTVPEWTNLQPGQFFTKTWRIKNTGSCPWTSDLSLVLDRGDALTAAPTKPLGINVAPGEITTVSVDLSAPTPKGKYSGEWKLRTAQGEIFGIGPDGASPLTVSINVDMPTEIGFSLAESFCQALWTTSKTTLSCPMAWDGGSGAAIVDAQPRFEGGYQDDEATIVIRPEDGTNGKITGRFPVYTVQEGDHFLSVIGCMEGNSNCDLSFELGASLDGGPIQSLGSWQEVYDGAFQKIQVDLSPYAGRKIELVLSVTSNTGTSKDNTGFWLLPIILR